MAHLADGAVAVVGGALHQHRRTAGRIALVAHLLVGVAVHTAAAALDGAVDGVSGHVGGQRLVDGRAQPRVGVGITAALAGGHGDLADELGEELAPLGVLGRLAELDVGPFAVSGHLWSAHSFLSP